jgi:NADPH-dependent 2,4-dienoyl-CoA reductase/sulfur reductase-like enzyme
MHYVIVGNGVAGVTAARRLRARDESARITMVSGESDYFFSRTALMYSFMDKMTLRDLEPYERREWKDLRIDLVRAWVTGLDAQGARLKLDTGREIAYDALLLATGSVARQPSWLPPDPPAGVVHFVTLQDLERCERAAPDCREAVVVGGGLIGVELVECLLHHRMQVSFLVKDPWYWPAALGGEEAEMIHAHLRRHGVNLLLDEQVQTIETDRGDRLAGVCLESGRKLPCQILGIAIGVEPQVGWLRNVATPPALSRGIIVDGRFRTSLPRVYAAGDCAEVSRPGEASFVEQIWYSAKRQGEAAALSMLGDAVDYRRPLFYNSAKFFEIEYTTVGQVNDAPPGAQQFFWRHPRQEASIRLLTLDDRLIGANLLGARWDHTCFERWIAERRDRSYVLAHLREAQFDVEFGRLDISEFEASRA